MSVGPDPVHAEISIVRVSPSGIFRVAYEACNSSKAPSLPCSVATSTYYLPLDLFRFPRRETIPRIREVILYDLRR